MAKVLLCLSLAILGTAYCDTSYETPIIPHSTYGVPQIYQQPAVQIITVVPKAELPLESKTPADTYGAPLVIQDVLIEHKVPNVKENEITKEEPIVTSYHSAILKPVIPELPVYRIPMVEVSQQEYGVPHQDYKLPISTTEKPKIVKSSYSFSVPVPVMDVVPEKVNGLPNEEYSAPSTEITPQEVYGVPHQEYGVPKVSKEHEVPNVESVKPVITTYEYIVEKPAEIYSTPPQEYGVPHKEYGVPKIEEIKLEPVKSVITTYEYIIAKPVEVEKPIKLKKPAEIYGMPDQEYGEYIIVKPVEVEKPTKLEKTAEIYSMPDQEYGVPHKEYGVPKIEKLKLEPVKSIITTYEHIVAKPVKVEKPTEVETPAEIYVTPAQEYGVPKIKELKIKPVKPIITTYEYNIAQPVAVAQPAEVYESPAVSAPKVDISEIEKPIIPHQEYEVPKIEEPIVMPHQDYGVPKITMLHSVYGVPKEFQN